jgi:putative transposase
MAVKFKHSSVTALYFCTFTCFHWLNLFSITNDYDIVYNWFSILKKAGIDVTAYVIMPNHVHCILYFHDEQFDLNKIVSNGKRFMAYELINRLEKQNNIELLNSLSDALTERENKKGQKHKVFKDFFDAKGIFTEYFFMQKLNYVHHNPVSGKWSLAKTFVDYEHSSAGFYEKGIATHFSPKHYKDL